MLPTFYSKILLLPFLIAGSAFASSGPLKCSATVLDLTTRKQITLQFREATSEDQRRVEKEWGGSMGFIPNSAKVVLAGETDGASEHGTALSIIVYPLMSPDNQETQLIRVVQFSLKQGRDHGSSLGSPQILNSKGALVMIGDMVSFRDGDKEIDIYSPRYPSYKVRCVQEGSEV